MFENPTCKGLKGLADSNKDSTTSKTYPSTYVPPLVYQFAAESFKRANLFKQEDTTLPQERQQRYEQNLVTVVRLQRQVREKLYGGVRLHTVNLADRLRLEKVNENPCHPFG